VLAAADGTPTAQAEAILREKFSIADD